jgi:hypothetical protein
LVTSESGPVTGSAASRNWRAGDWWSALFRLVLLLVLLAGALSVAASVNPPHRPESDLTRDIAAGRVTYLDYDEHLQEVRWVTGRWHWHETTLVTWDTGGDQSSSTGDPALTWLYEQIDGSGHFVSVRTHTGHESSWWPSKVVWDPLEIATVAAWIGTFLLMLGTTRHRYANRWAWFWLFTLGQAGALLYLVLEPQPIWRPRSWPPRGKPPIGGGTGFLWAILLPCAAGVAAYGIASLAR